jgi:hypothetical protein
MPLRRWRIAGQLTGLAAVLLVGVLLGHHFGDSTSAAARPAGWAPGPAGGTVVAQTDGVTTGLWSAAQFYGRVHEGDGRPQRTQVQWHSAISQPTFGVAS